MSTRVVLATYGSRGDVEPMVALAVALQDRGAQVVLCAPPDAEFTALVERSGVPARPFTVPWRSFAVPSPSAQRIDSVDDFVNGFVDATFQPLLDAVEGADVFVASGMLHFVASTVAELTGVRHRFVLFAPTVLDLPARDAAVRAPLDAHRASLGLPPLTDVRRHLFTGQPWVAADPVLEPVELPADVLRTPALVLDDPRPMPADLEEFLAAGEAPVYVGFGSMRVPAEVGATAVAAVRARGQRVVLARGWAEFSLAGDDCLLTGDVNQQALFPRVAAVVHHGGAGTTTTAALAGTPQVVVPQAADQLDWAARVGALGIGVAHDGPVPTVDSLAAALAVVGGESVRARAAVVAGEIRRDGAEVAARVVLGDV